MEGESQLPHIVLSPPHEHFIVHTHTPYINKWKFRFFLTINEAVRGLVLKCWISTFLLFKLISVQGCFAHTSVYASCECLAASESRRGHWFPWDWSEWSVGCCEMEPGHSSHLSIPFLVMLCLCFHLHTGSHSFPQAGLNIKIVPCQPPRPWGHRYGPPPPAFQPSSLPLPHSSFK